MSGETTITRTTNLTPFVGIPVEFTRELPDETRTRLCSYIGVFTALTHNWADPRPEFRSEDAGGMFEYRDRDGSHRTGMHVPYGSTIRPIREEVPA